MDRKKSKKKKIDFLLNKIMKISYLQNDKYFKMLVNNTGLQNFSNDMFFNFW